MLFSDLVSQSRSLLDDLTTGTDARDLLWSDKELLIFANEAVVEVAKRTESLRMDHTLTVAAGSNITNIPLTVLSLPDEATLAVVPAPITVPIEDEDVTKPVSWGRLSGVPTRIAYVGTSAVRHLTVNRRPAADLTVTLTSSIIPITPYASSDTIPISPMYQASLIHWVLHKAYMKHDSETEDIKRSRGHRSLFNEQIGPVRSAAMLEVHQTTGRAGRTRSLFY